MMFPFAGFLRLMALLFFPVIMQAQQYKFEQPKLKEYALPAIFTFFAGASDGLRDASLFYRVKDNGFFDGRNSWKRKYKNGDYKQGEAYLGSTSFLAFTTDGVHLSQAMTNQFNAWSMVTMPYDNNRKFSHLLLKVAAITAVRSIGHYAVYDLMFKNGNR